jgi:hypothetical protein
MKVTADKTITATFTPSATGGREGVNGDSTGKAEDKAKVILNQGQITFSPNPIIAGYSLPIEENILWKKVEATCTPAGNADDVMFRVKAGTENRLGGLVIRDQDTTTGKVKFEILCDSATEADAPYGDMTLEAFIDTEVIGEVQVIVVKPTAIGYPHEEFTKAVQGKAIAANETTSPVAFGVPDNMYKLCIVYMDWVDVQVVDQFGNRLSDEYEGQVVKEQAMVIFKPINQTIQADGTYKDPVGLRIGSTVTLPKDDPRVEQLLNDPNIPKLTGSEKVIQNKRVMVAGHELQPAIVNRTIKGIANTTIKVTWP